MPKRKLTDLEIEILKTIWMHGGETTERAIAEEHDMAINWMRLHLGRLGKADLVDVFKSGRVRITYRGRNELGLPGQPPPPMPSPPDLKSGKQVEVKREEKSIQVEAIQTLWGKERR